MDLHHDVFQMRILRIIAVVERSRVEAMPEIPPMTEQPYGTFRAFSGFGFHQRPHRSVDGNVRISEVVFSKKTGEIESIYGPEWAVLKSQVHFGQVGKDHKKAVLKAVLNGMKSAMPHLTDIEATFYHSSRFPKKRDTSRALRTPSS